ncbi:uncharacterized protein TRAVEDRAFT_42710 [Trametes versicolor FP-101664 SS1]|uniref:uncharacterized protein n=1 Tax=Trametes versicolor (strain FP-101664) TaxID=717944 RepID=UPI000462272E|nr:uncharacterized protein TRAVEDRAFT_42710 [Trametes versicolor FP-101664 SS1]EIW65334.1 hypothetical protein TRAVEDRAFT_42710 [Trametes versicolor FP-101664 SS1]
MVNEAEFLVLLSRLKHALGDQISQLSSDELRTALHIVSDAASDLKHRVNVIAPVSKLPTELLGLIFEFAKGHDERVEVEGGAPLTTKKTARTNLINITHVCRTWRAVALASPSLWADILVDDHTSRLPSADAFLGRSQTMPLYLHASQMRGADLARFLQGDGVASRIRRLDLSWDLFHDTPATKIELDAPLLECLTVVASRALRPIDLVISNARLKALTVSLRDDFIWTPKMSFSHVTHLYMDAVCHYWDYVPYGLGPLLMGVLMNMPALQYLHLVRLTAEVFEEAEPEPELQPVALPQLQWFACVDSNPSASLRLLLYLLLPESAFVYVGHGCGAREQTTLEPPYEFPSRELVQSFTHMEIAAYDRDLRLVAEGPHSGLWVEGRYASPSEVQCLQSCLLAMLPLASICTLDFLINNAEAVHVLHNLLHRTPSLVALRVRVHPDLSLNGRSSLPSPTLGPVSPMDLLEEAPVNATCGGLMEDLLAALKPGDGAQSAPCPTLTSIDIDVHKLNPQDAWTADIALMLAARAGVGAPVRHLAVRTSVETLVLDENLEVGQGNNRDALDETEDYVRGEDLSVVPMHRHEWDMPEEAGKYWIVPDWGRPQYTDRLYSFTDI